MIYLLTTYQVTLSPSVAFLVQKLVHGFLFHAVGIGLIWACSGSFIFRR